MHIFIFFISTLKIKNEMLNLIIKKISSLSDYLYFFLYKIGALPVTSSTRDFWPLFSMPFLCFDFFKTCNYFFASN